MNLNLRQAIIQRVAGKSDDELYEVIRDSIDGDERALPGLGVLFEIIWKGSDDTTKHSLVSTLHNGLT
ncbi:small acid-soluble spore protein SspI [Paenibacillus thermoaerophilus]|uniref:Small, acid-soluble spore protein I n=1 Tax=Paenibacillus thermoaerophilus TaxID=1215385 RepID=A0ABW2V1I4_9BACL|nr:small acid-soluble spore protein SspI [Paenibacillus thermoaerophilus]TMV18525.1 small acid-soluble spore protein SspI [Paenibacillus thermoaerophilus]